VGDDVGQRNGAAFVQPPQAVLDRRVGLLDRVELAAQALDRACITTNYNAVPFDPRSPFDPSGIRLGTPAVTTRGMTEVEMEPIARWLEEGVQAAKREDEPTIERIAREVREFAAGFPLPDASGDLTIRPHNQ